MRYALPFLTLTTGSAAMPAPAEYTHQPLPLNSAKRAAPPDEG